MSAGLICNFKTRKAVSEFSLHVGEGPSFGILEKMYVAKI